LVILNFFHLFHLQELELPCQCMTIEITEGLLLKADFDVTHKLLELRDAGIQVSIDDFGTGNSSLAQLRDIPFDELKIDQSFVHGAHRDEKLCSMFDSSLSLAKQLMLEVVAEGGEDQADWDFVRNRGCDIAQGYFIAKPMPAADLPEWIHSWQSVFIDASKRI